MRRRGGRHCMGHSVRLACASNKRCPRGKTARPPARMHVRRCRALPNLSRALCAGTVQWRCDCCWPTSSHSSHLASPPGDEGCGGRGYGAGCRRCSRRARRRRAAPSRQLLTPPLEVVGRVARKRAWRGTRLRACALTRGLVRRPACRSCQWPTGVPPEIELHMLRPLCRSCRGPTQPSALRVLPVHLSRVAGFARMSTRAARRCRPRRWGWAG